MDCLHAHKKNGVILQVHIQPKAATNQIVGLHGDALKCRIKSPPVDGKANKMLIALLAKTFGVAKQNVTLEAGQSSRSKRLCITGVTYQAAESILSPYISVQEE